MCVCVYTHVQCVYRHYISLHVFIVDVSGVPFLPSIIIPHSSNIPLLNPGTLQAVNFINILFVPLPS